MTHDDRTARHASVPDLTGRTADDALRAATSFLAACSIDGGAVDARRLLLHVTGTTALDLVRDGRRVLTSVEARRYADALARRSLSEPVSRITGVRGFYGRDFVVTADTLDPRADTETLIEAALALARDCGLDQRAIEIVDVGTGTGCILITLVAELPLARGIGIDVSAAALAVAAENGRRLGVADRVRFVEGRGLATGAVTADLIVSNPPYVRSGDIAGLDRDVRDYDPHVALDGGGDGLDIYRDIAGALVLRDRPGWALFEVGAGQAEDVAELLLHRLGRRHHEAGERRVRTFPDLGGIERCVAISTQS